MLPIKDEVRSRSWPIWTWALIAANVLVFVYELLLGKRVDDLIMTWGFVPARFFSYLDWPTVFSSMFMHAGWLHIIGNMLYLWIFGDNVEDVMGKLLYPFFYLASGIVAVLAHALLFPGSDVPLVGASGAIAGVLGAYLLFFPKARVLTVVFTIPFSITRIPSWILLLIWFGLQIVNSLLTASASGGAGVAYLAHIGGFGAGFLLALPVYIIRRVAHRYPFA